MRIIFLCLLLFSCLEGAERRSVRLVPALEEALNNVAAVQTKQIAIPKYPNAFNPSLIPYGDGYLLSFRIRGKIPWWKKVPRGNAAYVGLVKLDREMNVLKKTVQFLDIYSHSPKPSLSAEDARLFVFQNRIFVFFNDLPEPRCKDFAMYFGELIEKKGKFELKGPAKRLRYDRSIGIEKNWVPFEAEGKLYAVYSDQPRVILEVDLESGVCKEAAAEEGSCPWHWGRIRGGTPAYSVEEGMLAFFHSCIPVEPLTEAEKKKPRRNYAMGAYLFDPSPPFSLRAVTEVPLGSRDDYLKDNRRKVVFPCGAVVEGDKIHVSWGKTDKKIFITTYDKKKLVSSMTYFAK